MTAVQEHAHGDAGFISILSKLGPSKVTRGATKRDPQFTAHQVNAIYAARQRKVSWKDIHAALLEQEAVTNYTRASTLAQVVHDCARRHGIEPYITVHRGKSTAA